MTRLILLACLAGAAAIVAATYLHLERAMRRTETPRGQFDHWAFWDRWARNYQALIAEPWVEPYDGEAIGV